MAISGILPYYSLNVVSSTCNTLVLLIVLVAAVDGLFITIYLAEAFNRKRKHRIS